MTLKNIATKAYNIRIKKELEIADKEKARINKNLQALKSRKVSKLIPLIEKQVKKDISAGWWRIQILDIHQDNYDEYEDAMYEACRKLGLHYRGMQRLLGSLSIEISIHPEEYNPVIGNTD